MAQWHDLLITVPELCFRKGGRLAVPCSIGKKSKGLQGTSSGHIAKVSGFFLLLWLPLSPSYVVRAEKHSTHTGLSSGL